jgi:hypothetical protein
MPRQGAMPGPVPAGRPPVGDPASGNMPGSSRLRSAWKTGPDGKTIFRLVPPLVLWWCWVAFAVINVADLAIQSHSWFAVEVTAGLALATGLMFACAFRPMVISDADGLKVRNPFRSYLVPWGAITGVYVGDSVEIGALRPSPLKEKTIYSWALYSPRRSRARAEMRTSIRASRKTERPSLWSGSRRYEVDAGTYGKLPEQAKQIATQHPSHIMAGELAKRRAAAVEAGAPEATLSGRWDWVSIAAVLVPAAAVVAVILAR